MPVTRHPPHNSRRVAPTALPEAVTPEHP